MKSHVSKFAALVLFAFSASISQAAFNITVASTGGPGFATYTTSATSVTAFNLNPAGGGLLQLDYNINNTPASGALTINNLSFLYFGNASPINLQVTISENAANFLGTGTALTGLANFNTVVGSSPADTFNNNTTFTPGSGGNINFPTANFTFASTPYAKTSTFTSGGSIGTISTVFNLALQPGSNVGVNSAGGYGVFGVTGFVPAPAPPAVFAGLFAVPTLAMLRRRFRR